MLDKLKALLLNKWVLGGAAIVLGVLVFIGVISPGDVVDQLPGGGDVVE